MVSDGVYVCTYDMCVSWEGNHRYGITLQHFTRTGPFP